MATDKRPIFQDVQSSAPQAKAVKMRDDNPKSVRIWLWILFALVVAMILLGGLTRLTDSGLSITEWDLLKGFMPPLNDAAWQEAFGKYQQTQEFRQQNSAMNLAQFQTIFWWEWSHRFLGRMIGLVWIVGFLWFWIRKSIRRDRFWSIFMIGVLIGLQGAIGWWMVTSGYFGENTDVESYRLATHLAMAFWIVGQTYWNAKMLKRTPAELVEARRRGNASLVTYAKWVAGFVILQVILGALVAGIDGGLSYNDWPMMGGEFFSSDAFVLEPIWRNFFETAALVQFIHRMNGYLIAVLALILMIRTWRAPYKQWRSLGKMFFFAIILQIVIGVTVLLRHVQIGEALSHQALAIGIWILALGLVFALRYPRSQTLKA